MPQPLLPRIAQPLLLIITIVLFFLPFAQLRFKVNEDLDAMLKMSGLESNAYDFRGSDMVFGSGASSASVNIGDVRLQVDETASGRIWPALIAFVLSLAALFVSLLPLRNRSLFAGLAAALAAISLLLVMAQMRSFVERESGLPLQEFKELAELVYTPWYYLAIGLLALVAVLGFLHRGRAVSHRAVPPANAPQTPLNNPGDQSDFPAAPRESDLG